MNHYPHFSSPGEREAVTVDLSASVAELSTPRSAMGHAVSLVFRTLEFDEMLPPSPSDMLVIGSQRSIERNQRRLRLNIGKIAQVSNETAKQFGYHGAPFLADRLDDIAQSVIPKAIEGNEFITSVGTILGTFGEDCNDDGCGVEYGLRVGWYGKSHDENTEYLKLPKQTRQRLEIPVLQPEIARKDASRDLWALRMLAFHWAIDHGDALKKRGLTPSLMQEYERECELNSEAIQHMNRYLFGKTGRSIEKLFFPADVIRELVASERKTMEAEEQRKAWLDRLYPKPTTAPVETTESTPEWETYTPGI